MSVLSQIRSDYRRYRASDDTLFATLLSQGLWTSVIYRTFRAVQERVHIPVVRKILLLTGNLIGKLNELPTGIFIPLSCKIGDGLYIGHFGNIFFPSHGSLGKNCNVSQGVTMGVAGTGDERGAPTVGDRVYIGPNAIVVGKITVGDDAVICAGAVVTKSVPPRAVVLGNPARVVSYSGSFHYIAYDGMENDPERIRSMQLSEQSGWGTKTMGPQAPGAIDPIQPAAPATKAAYASTGSTNNGDS